MYSGKKVLIFVCFITMIGISSLLAQVIDRPVASVRLHTTTVITMRQIQSKISLLEQELGITMNAEQKMSLLNSEVDTELLMQAANRANIVASDQEINNAIALQRQSLGLGPNVSDQVFRQIIQEQAGMSWDEYLSLLSKRIIQEKFIAQDNRALLSQSFTPSQNAIERVYQENISEFLAPAYVRFDHLFIDTRNASAQDRQAKRAKMEDFSRRITSGGRTAFDQLIRASVDDPEFSGGDFGFLPRGEQTTTQLLGRNFIDQVFSLAEGEKSGVLESNLGFHVVWVTQKRSPKLLELNDPVAPGGNLTVRQQIIQYLQAERQQELMAQAINASTARLREQAEIRIFNQNINW